MTDPTQDSDSDMDARMRAALETSGERPPAHIRAAILEHARQVAAQQGHAHAGSASGDPVGTAPPLNVASPANDPRWHVAALAAAAVVAALIAWPLLDSSQRATLATQGVQHPAGRDATPAAPGTVALPPTAPATLPVAPAAAPVTNPAPSPAMPPAMRPSGPAPSARREAPPPADIPITPAASPAVADIAAEPATSAPTQRLASDAASRSKGSGAIAASAAGALPRPVSSPPDRATVMDAVLGDDVDRLRRALQAGGDVNALDAAGRTALLVATQRHALPIVSLLLAQGADPNIAAPSGDTPLRVARRLRFDDLAAVLVASGARD